MTIRHEDDFAFPKLKEELAVKIRSEQLPKIRDQWSVQDIEVSFDNDGDIMISTDKGTLYVTRDYVFLSAKGETIASIVEGNALALNSGVLGEFFQIRSPLRAELYVLRFFIRLKFDVPLTGKELEALFPKNASRLSNNLALPKANFSWSVNWSEGEFEDKFEFQRDSLGVALRYARQCQAGKFNSLKEFVSAAAIGQLLPRLQDFLEPLLADREH